MPDSAPQSDDRTPPIRDAACLILVDRSGPDAKLLLGQRLQTQVFLPNKWVFPGGRVDDDDRSMAAALPEHRAPPRGATNPGGGASLSLAQMPFVLSAIRELLEETGLIFGHRIDAPVKDLPPAWQAIADLGYAPRFEGISPIARAITPPGFPRRFDTWFFLADWQADTRPVGAPDGEFSALDWFTLAAARDLELPYITRLIVDDVATLLAGEKGTQIPFYFQDGNTYRRVLVD